MACDLRPRNKIMIDGKPPTLSDNLVGHDAASDYLDRFDVESLSTSQEKLYTDRSDPNWSKQHWHFLYPTILVLSLNPWYLRFGV